MQAKHPMNNSKVGRNDPCPCGSGKKFKHCCLNLGRDFPSPEPMPGLPDDLRALMDGMQFESLEELQSFVEQYSRQKNETPTDDFDGLSPEQMYRMLHFAYESAPLVVFEEVLQTDPQAPIMVLFQLLIDAIGEKGLKPTATGNLPRNFCREAAISYWGAEKLAERTKYRSINQEPDFHDLHTTRIVAEIAGLIRKHNGRFILSSECRRLLKRGGPRAIYPSLLRTYTESFNWSYLDGFPDLKLIQTSFLFTLYLLKRHGATAKDQIFYENAFLRAFPAIIDEVPENSLLYRSPESVIGHAYTWRALVNFAAYFGLAAVKPKSDEFLCHEYEVTARPLLDQVLKFKIKV